MLILGRMIDRGVVLSVAVLVCVSFGNVVAQSKACDEVSDFEGHIATESAIIDKNPGDVEALIRRGYAYYRSGKQDLALKDLDRAIQLDSISERAYEMRGRIYAHQAKYKEAIADFTKSLEIDPRFRMAFYSRARSHQFSGKPALAIQDFQEAIKLETNDAASHAAIGIELKKLGRNDEASLWLNKAVEIHTTRIKQANPIRCNSILYSFRGMALYWANRYNEALEDYNKTIELQPQDFEAYFYRGHLFDSISALYQALNDLTKSIELNPFFAESYLLRAYVYDRLKDKKAAKSDRLRYKELSDPNPPKSPATTN